MKAIIITTALLLAMTQSVVAEPFDPSQVPADAKWLAHIDFDAAREAGLAKKVYDVWIGQDPVKHRLLVDQFRLIFGMNPIEDIKSVTVFSTRYVPESGVVIFRAKMDQSRLGTLLGQNPTHKTTSYGKHTLHRWTEDKGGKREHTAGCFHGPTVAVVGQDVEQVKAVLDVLDGKAPSLTDGAAQLKQAAAPGAVFVARAIDLDEAGLPFKSPIVPKTELLALAVGEHDGDVFVQVRLVSSEKEVAEQVRTVVMGLKAVALLQQAENEHLVKALQAVEIAVDDKTVTVGWQASVDDVIDLVKKERARRQKAIQEN